MCGMGLVVCVRVCVGVGLDVWWMQERRQSVVLRFLELFVSSFSLGVYMCDTTFKGGGLGAEWELWGFLEGLE